MSAYLPDPLGDALQCEICGHPAAHECYVTTPDGTLWTQLCERCHGDVLLELDDAATCSVVLPAPQPTLPGCADAPAQPPCTLTEDAPASCEAGGGVAATASPASRTLPT